MRVHELAKELGISSKELLPRLGKLGMEAKSHMSALTEEQVLQVRGQEAPAAAAEPEPAPVPAPPPAAQKATPPEEEPQAPAEAEPAPEADDTKIIVRGPIIVKEFATELGLKPNQLIAELMMMNVFASINQRIDIKIAQQLAEKHGKTLEQEKKPPERKPPAPRPEKRPLEPEEDRDEDLVARPPIVTFLGHVDHGKTSLLDRIRDTGVAAGEDGGITQHIGASTVEYHDHRITFLDTPGHAAFTAMRARGANLTDIAVLVIAADDGLMPQTREAIKHAQAAGVCMMVAINKIDLKSANVERVKQQLQQEELAPEDWGGELICCPVSAVTGEGLDHLLEMILLQAEVLELKANPKRRAQGYVIEARLEPGMGPTASLLVRRGTLHVGDTIVCGPSWGRIKALINDQGIKVRTAGPSSAVKCLGLTNVPEAGAEFEVYPNDRMARAIAEERLAEKRQSEMVMPKRASLDDLLDHTAPQQAQTLALVLKADVQGTLEAIAQALGEILSDKIRLKIILSSVGNITENDILLASASNAVIIGFHVSLENGVRRTAKHEGVEIRLYSVIYELLDEVREAMTGLLAPEYREKLLGHAEVRQVFLLSKRGKAAGCMVMAGRAKSRAKARVRRADEIIYEGTLESLRRFQNDASEVREGQECGLQFDNFSEYEVGDVIEFYEMEKIAQEL